MGQDRCFASADTEKLIQPVRWASGLRGPFGVKACSVIKRFLSSDAGCGQGCVEIGAANRFLFGHALGKKNGKASDKSIARSAAVNTVDSEGRHVCATIAASE